MSKTTNVNIRMDADLKREVEALLSCMGLNMSTAINMFAHQIIRHQAIPFEVSARNIPNAETLAAIEEGECISRDSSVKGYTSAEELFKALGV